MPSRDGLQFCQSTSLFHNIVEILDLTYEDRRAMLLVVAPDGCRVGFTPIKGHCCRHTMPVNRLGEPTLGGLFVALLRQEKINRLAGLIDRAIEVVPLPLDLDIDILDESY